MGLPANSSTATPPPELAPVSAYLAAVSVTVVAILSPYFLPKIVPAVQPVYDTFVTGYLVVYGIPILAFFFLVGLRPLRGFFSNPGSAVFEGVRWYGAMSALGLVAAFVIVGVLATVDPSAISQLSKLSPPLKAAESDPWFWVAFSFVVGIVEETIFRGWIFGYWLLRNPSGWFVHAVWTSVLFASMHLYYGSTYGVASGVAFAELFFAGLGFSFAVRYSRGNLLVVGLLHGVHDALGFLNLVWKPEAEELFYLVILIGVVVFVVAAMLQDKPSTRLTAWEPGPGPPPTGPGGNPAIAWPPAPAGTFDRPPLPAPPPPSEPRPPSMQ